MAQPPRKKQPVRLCLYISFADIWDRPNCQSNYTGRRWFHLLKPLHNKAAESLGFKASSLISAGGKQPA